MDLWHEFYLEVKLVYPPYLMNLADDRLFVDKRYTSNSTIVHLVYAGIEPHKTALRPVDDCAWNLNRHPANLDSHSLVFNKLTTERTYVAQRTPEYVLLELIIKLLNLRA